MFGWFGKKELITTFDSKIYFDTIAKLNAAGIPYKTKLLSSASTGRLPRVFGSAGEVPDHNTQYYIYVLEKDFDKAKLQLR